MISVATRDIEKNLCKVRMLSFTTCARAMYIMQQKETDVEIFQHVQIVYVSVPTNCEI